MSETERCAVQALLDNPGRSPGALSGQAGWGRSAWQLHFGKLCKSRVHLLWAAPPDQERPSRTLYCGILADFDLETRGYTLKPEAVKAFEELGLRPQGWR
jgi:hypothetical protein